MQHATRSRKRLTWQPARPRRGRRTRRRGRRACRRNRLIADDIAVLIINRLIAGRDDRYLLAVDVCLRKWIINHAVTPDGPSSRIAFISALIPGGQVRPGCRGQAGRAATLALLPADQENARADSSRADQEPGPARKSRVFFGE